MSKIGQFILEQIELGNYTIDERGKYDVSLEDRKRSAVTRASSDSVHKHGTGGFNTDPDKKESDSGTIRQRVYRENLKEEMKFSCFQVEGNQLRVYRIK